VLKKILVGFLFIALVGILIAGAIIRTMDKTTQSTSEGGSNQGSGRNALLQEARIGESQVHAQHGLSAAKGDDATGSGQARGGNGGQGSALNEENPQRVWESYDGVLLSVTVDALTMETAEGETILVDGRTWSFAQELGFAAEEGDEVRLEGFIEDGEFKVVSIENLITGDEVVLRDASGRPGWSGWSKGGI
jgi:hypothetical protein